MSEGGEFVCVSLQCPLQTHHHRVLAVQQLWGAGVVRQEAEPHLQEVWVHAVGTDTEERRSVV